MKKKGSMKRIVIFLLTASLLIVTGVSALASAIDFTHPVSLTVGIGEQPDLAKADVVIDVYKVADAAKVDGVDTYTYQALAPFTQMQEDITAENLTNSDWRDLAQDAIGLALETAADGSTVTQKADPVITGVKPDTAITEDSEGNKLMPGLYLIVAHSADVAGYLVTETATDGTASTATVARSDTYMYNFAPQLVALPTKPATTDETTGEEVRNTADDGDWIYDLPITLKYEYSNGGLVIEKILDTYEAKDPATFIFDVEAELYGKNVYSNVVSMTFSNAGLQTVSISDIPTGADVTIEEIYSGANYELTADSSQTQKVKIPASGEARVSFTNTYDDTFQGGGSLVNSFNLDEEGHWQLTKIRNGEVMADAAADE